MDLLHLILVHRIKSKLMISVFNAKEWILQIIFEPSHLGEKGFKHLSITVHIVLLKANLTSRNKRLETYN